MIPVSDALAHLFDLAAALGSESIPLAKAAGRVLIEPASARRDQPPFAASAMDGYGVLGDDAIPGARLTLIGESAAGHGFDGQVTAGNCIRIFTGAPVPKGVTRVILQEDVSREGDIVILGDRLDKGPHIRPAGADFRAGDTFAAPRRLTATDLALLAAMNIPTVTVSIRPKVAIMATGDELVMPGETPGPDQIIASNSFGLKAMLDALGAEARMLPIARDNRESLEMAFSLAEDADLLLTIGGASVGDHDLVGDVAAGLGMARSFYKIAMRPGKPLMAGRLKSGAMMIGLPGNPVSAMVCGEVFVTPVIRAMLGLGAAPAPRQSAKLLGNIAANGPREHYMRAFVENGKLRAFESQDSALLTILSQANALLIRRPNAVAAASGDSVEYLPI